jgi:hypothetical protein
LDLGQEVSDKCEGHDEREDKNKTQKLLSDQKEDHNYCIRIVVRGDGQDQQDQNQLDKNQDQQNEDPDQHHGQGHQKKDHLSGQEGLGSKLS